MKHYQGKLKENVFMTINGGSKGSTPEVFHNQVKWRKTSLLWFWIGTMGTMMLSWQNSFTDLVLISVMYNNYVCVCVCAWKSRVRGRGNTQLIIIMIIMYACMCVFIYLWFVTSVKPFLFLHVCKNFVVHFCSCESFLARAGHALQLSCLSVHPNEWQTLGPIVPYFLNFLNFFCHSFFLLCLTVPSYYIYIYVFVCRGGGAIHSLFQDPSLV